jgi:hypothetical protein
MHVSSTIFSTTAILSAAAIASVSAQTRLDANGCSIATSATFNKVFQSFYIHYSHFKMYVLTKNKPQHNIFQTTILKCIG